MLVIIDFISKLSFPLNAIFLVASYFSSSNIPTCCQNKKNSVQSILGFISIMSPFDKRDLKFLGVISMPVFGSIIFGIRPY
ncbi:hypothetical protein DM10_04750 [Borreliella garinii]|nr:hypothetical protein DM10_04750 [Borreliella garinii]